MKLSNVFGIVLSLHIGVILLVMFQPGCQTAGVRPGVDQNSSVDTEVDQSFNQGVVETSAEVIPESEPVAPVKKTFATPTRPKPGELIVPVEPESLAPESTPVLVPSSPSPVPIGLRPSDLAIYKIERGDTLWGIARKNGVSLADLLNTNPNLDKNSRLSIGQEVMIPAVGQVASSAPQITPSPTVSSPVSSPTYKVQRGDTLSGIARKHGVPLSVLLKENNLALSTIIRVGQTLVIPSDFSPSVPSPSPARLVPPGATTHTVEKGENLSRISAIYGVSVSDIMEWNGLSNPGMIRSGQTLIVSQASSPEPVPVRGNIIVPESPKNIVAPPADPSSTLQDFFNDSEGGDRPIIDVSESP
jgi:LysM repeat protein